MQISDVPWMTSAKNTGTPVCRDMLSAPVATAAKNSAEGTTPRGLSAASMATTIPA
jgi:hypothetical protein